MTRDTVANTGEPALEGAEVEPGRYESAFGEVDRSVDDLIHRYRGAAGRHGSRRLVDLGRELLTSGDSDAIGEWLCSDNRLHSDTGPGGRSGPLDAVLRGVLLRGRDGGLPADNAWHIPSDASLEQAIRHVWEPLADVASDAVELLVERVFALALVTHADGDSLAYLFGDELPENVTDWSSATVTDLVYAASQGADVCWGDAPVTGPGLPATLGSLPFPAALTRLAGVHGALHFAGMEAFVEPTRPRPYDGWLDDQEDDDDDEDYEDDDSDAPEWESFQTDGLFVVGGHVDGLSVLDLHRVDDEGNPMVVDHDCNDGLYMTRPSPFWDHFNSDVRFYVTGGE